MNTLSTGVNASIEAEGNMKHSMGKEDLGFTLSGMRRAGWLPGQLAPIQLSLNFTGFSQARAGPEASLDGTMAMSIRQCVVHKMIAPYVLPLTRLHATALTRGKPPGLAQLCPAVDTGCDLCSAAER